MSFYCKYLSLSWKVITLINNLIFFCILSAFVAGFTPTIIKEFWGASALQQMAEDKFFITAIKAGLHGLNKCPVISVVTQIMVFHIWHYSDCYPLLCADLPFRLLCMFCLNSTLFLLLIFRPKKYHAIVILLQLTHFYLPPADRPGTGDYKMPDVRPSVRPCVCASVRSSRFIKGFITPLFMNINSPNLHKRFISTKACLS